MLKDFAAENDSLVELLKIVGTILGALCGIFSAGKFIRRYLKVRKRRQIAAEERTPAKIAEKSVEILRGALIENLHYVKKLTTIEQFIEGNIPLKKHKKLFNFNVGTTECTLIYKGKITCGCDLQKIRFVPSENISGGVKILSPHCRIIEAFVDINTVKIIYEKKSKFFTPEVMPEEQIALISDDFDKLKQHKIDEGILTAADAKVYEILLKLSDNKKISVEINFLDEYVEPPKLNPPTEDKEG